MTIFMLSIGAIIPAAFRVGDVIYRRLKPGVNPRLARWLVNGSLALHYGLVLYVGPSVELGIATAWITLVKVIYELL